MFSPFLRSYMYKGRRCVIPSVYKSISAIIFGVTHQQPWRIPHPMNNDSTSDGVGYGGGGVCDDPKLECRK